VSVALVQAIERHRRDAYRDRSLIAVSKALGWPADALEQIHDGADPDDLTPAANPRAEVEAYITRMELADGLERVTGGANWELRVSRGDMADIDDDTLELARRFLDQAFGRP